MLRDMSMHGWSAPEEIDVDGYLQTPYDALDTTNDYPHLMTSYSGPSASARKSRGSPIALFFYFLLVDLWRHIASETNAYGAERLEERAQAALCRHWSMRRKKPNLQPKTIDDMRKKLHSAKPIKSYEICRWIGLIIARSIAPNREKIGHHWKTTDDGAIERGAFGLTTARDRFMAISCNLHFNSNADPRAKTDRAWKLRRVVTTLQQTF